MLGKDPLVQHLARTFGENVRVLRESEHLTKKELADMVGSSRSHITDIEDGLIDADFSKVVKFARAFERPSTPFWPPEEPSIPWAGTRGSSPAAQPARARADGVSGARLAGADVAP